MSKKFYEILEISPNSNPEEIKRAYRKLSLRWHPDKNNNSVESIEFFQKIQAAYEILSDPVARKKYDKNFSANLWSKKTF